MSRTHILDDMICQNRFFERRTNQKQAEENIAVYSMT